MCVGFGGKDREGVSHGEEGNYKVFGGIALSLLHPAGLSRKGLFPSGQEREGEEKNKQNKEGSQHDVMCARAFCSSN